MLLITLIYDHVKYSYRDVCILYNLFFSFLFEYRSMNLCKQFFFGNRRLILKNMFSQQLTYKLYIMPLQNELCRTTVDFSVLDELVHEYCIYRGIAASVTTSPSGKYFLSFL